MILPVISLNQLFFRTTICGSYHARRNFGPVVGFIKVKDFDEAIEVANDTDYGLTGAVITNHREHWIKAVNEFDVGNLYLNRGCTAAVVGYHPFGGFKMSGTDAKTGSPDYLLNFLEQKLFPKCFNLYITCRCNVRE